MSAQPLTFAQLYGPQFNIQLHSKQQAFNQSTADFTWFCGGVGTGKTSAGILKAFDLAWNVHPGFTGIFAAPSIPHIQKVVLREWARLIPRPFWQLNKNNGVMTLANGSTIIFTTTQGDVSLQGHNAAWFVYDEAAFDPNFNESWERLVARLRRGARGRKMQGFVTSTPNGAAHGTARVFGTGHTAPGFTGTKDHWTSLDGKYAVVRASTRDNPYLPAEYINNLLSKAYASPEYIAQFVEAQFTSRRGLVFSEFNIAKHVYKAPIPTATFIRIYGGFDVGYSDDGVLLSVGKTRDGTFHVFKEERHGSRSMLCDPSGWFPIIKDMRNLRPQPDWIVVDSAAAERIAALRVYLHNSPLILSSTKDTHGSIRRIQKLFHENKLLIHESCTGLIQELQNWNWKVNKQTGQSLDEPEAGNDHACDSLRYLIFHATGV